MLSQAHDVSPIFIELSEVPANVERHQTAIAKRKASQSGKLLLFRIRPKTEQRLCKIGVLPAYVPGDDLQCEVKRNHVAQLEK
jgi:hypothetical protein